VPERESAGVEEERTTIFLSAGEPSGDLHGAALARALRSRIPGVRLIGLGGDRMRAEGVELLAEVDELAVMGFVEVLSRLPFFVRLRRRVFDALARERVHLVIPLDYPGFNLRLARHATRLGVPVLYYIAPQVWAWHSSRVKQLAEDARAVAVILPFEEPFLRERGVEAEFVGHPLVEAAAPELSREEWCARHGLDPGRPLLALFPGSRGQEVRRHLALFEAAAAELRRRFPAVQPVIGASPDLPPDAYASASVPLSSSPRELLHLADAALVKSGTTTLEAALAGTPFVVAYRMHPLSWALARRLVKVPHVALANLVADERLAPELLQDAATPTALADALLPLLDAGSSDRARMLEGFARIRAALGDGGAAARVAEMAAELLEPGR
jgi:lipid-A-disaccharide synthase